MLPGYKKLEGVSRKEEIKQVSLSKYARDKYGKSKAPHGEGVSRKGSGQAGQGQVNHKPLTRNLNMREFGTRERDET